MEPIGIIGGSGFYDLLENPEVFIGDNKYGRSSEIFRGKIDGQPVYFIPRHGPEHRIIVPRINYRANIYALWQLGVRRIFATNSVGSMNPEMEPGDMVVPDDFFDMTRRYPRSMYDDVPVAYHVDMCPAFCPTLRRALIDAANQVRPGHTHDHGVLFVDEGLRFNTPFELKVYRQLGGDLVGMTSIPEVVFAREMAMCYATICMPNNWAMGEQTDCADFPALLKQGVEDFKAILRIAIKNVNLEEDCVCKHALDSAVLAKQ